MDPKRRLMISPAANLVSVTRSAAGRRGLRRARKILKRKAAGSGGELCAREGIRERKKKNSHLIAAIIWTISAQLLYIAELKRSRAALSCVCVCCFFLFPSTPCTRFMAEKYSWRKLLSKNKNTRAWLASITRRAVRGSLCARTSSLRMQWFISLYFSFVRKRFLSRGDTALYSAADRHLEIVLIPDT